jgi:uncharacterized membrane protein YhaH (DUF805 family)
MKKAQLPQENFSNALRLSQNSSNVSGQSTPHHFFYYFILFLIIVIIIKVMTNK